MSIMVELWFGIAIQWQGPILGTENEPETEYKHHKGVSLCCVALRDTIKDNI